MYVCAKLIFKQCFCACCVCIRLTGGSLYVCVLCPAEVMSEMSGRHVEAIGTWSGAERGRCVHMVVVSPWLLRVTWPAGERPLCLPRTSRHMCCVRVIHPKPPSNPPLGFLAACSHSRGCFSKRGSKTTNERWDQTGSSLETGRWSRGPIKVFWRRRSAWYTLLTHQH